MDIPALQYATTPDGFSIAYTVCGQGEPLVFLPNPMCHTHLYWRSRNVFSLLYGHLAERFTLITFDSRGQGSSQRGLTQFHNEDFYTDLETVVEHLGLQRFSMLAQNGVRPALKFATLYPERVRAIVLWNPFVGDPVLDGWDPANLEAMAADNWEFYIDMMARIGWAPEDPEVAKHLLREAISQADCLLMIRSWREYTLTDILERVRTPVLLLTSGKGKFPMAGEDASKFVASRIRGSRLEILDDFGAGLFTLEPGTPAGVLLMDDFFGKLPADDKAATQTKAALQDGLSQREVEVLRLLAAGRSNQQIADELVISLNTVRRHVSNVFDKTGVANRTEASVYARDHGIA